jgi:hypothetical protein
VITAADVTACLVTRGDTDLSPILETLPYGEIVVWDNSKRANLKVYGRYAAIAEASNPVIYFQDDDCIFRHHDELLAAYKSGVLVANWGHGSNPDGYDDLAIFPGGAILDRGLPAAAFDRYLKHFPRNDGFLYEADFIFGCLTPHEHLHLPFEIRDLAYNGKRLADEPWQRELKLKITNQARWVRDNT